MPAQICLRHIVRRTPLGCVPPLVHCCKKRAAREAKSERRQKGELEAKSEPTMDPAEKVRFGVATGDPPEAPKAFDSSYVLPVHSTKLLESRHSHALDAGIYMNEQHHVYRLEYADYTVAAACSVSGIAAPYTAPFIPATVARGMLRSRKWPRADYLIDKREIHHVDEFCGTRGAMICDKATGESVSMLLPPIDADGIVLYTMLEDAMTYDVPRDAQRWYTFERPMLLPDILSHWEANGEEARNRGTEAHYQLERWCNSMPCREDKEVLIGIAFIRDVLAPEGVQCYRTEMEIHAKDELVAGSVDLVVSRPAYRVQDCESTTVTVDDGGRVDGVAVSWNRRAAPGTYPITFVAETLVGAKIELSGGLYEFANPKVFMLIDWKRSEKLPSKMTGRSPMKPPLAHLDDCSGCMYALQLGLYKWILQKYYQMSVKGLVLVSVHPAAPFHTAVPYMEREVEFLMATCRHRQQARIALSKSEEGKPYICALSGLFTPTPELHEGKLYDSKMARLQGIPSRPCPATTDAAASLLQRRMEHIELDQEKLIPWKTLYPHTLPVF